MRCPKCERETYVRFRVGDVRIKPATLPEGVLLAALRDGTCYTCMREATGKRVRPWRRPTRVEAKESDIDRFRRQEARYVLGRRARGIPADGLHTTTLVKPGLFLMEVR